MSIEGYIGVCFNLFMANYGCVWVRLGCWCVTEEFVCRSLKPGRNIRFSCVLMCMHTVLGFFIWPIACGNILGNQFLSNALLAGVWQIENCLISYSCF